MVKTGQLEWDLSTCLRALLNEQSRLAHLVDSCTLELQALVSTHTDSLGAGVCCMQNKERVSEKNLSARADAVKEESHWDTRRE